MAITNPKEGDVIWVKFKSLPFWPVEVEKIEGNRMHIIFFGDGARATKNLNSKMYPFECDRKPEFISDGEAYEVKHPHEQFKKAMKEAAQKAKPNRRSSEGHKSKRTRRSDSQLTESKEDKHTDPSAKRKKGGKSKKKSKSVERKESQSEEEGQGIASEPNNSNSSMESDTDDEMMSYDTAVDTDAFNEGDVVWARQKSRGYWPSKVLKVDTKGKHINLTCEYFNWKAPEFTLRLGRNKKVGKFEDAKPFKPKSADYEKLKQDAMSDRSITSTDQLEKAISDAVYYVTNRALSLVSDTRQTETPDGLKYLPGPQLTKTITSTKPVSKSLVVVTTTKRKVIEETESTKYIRSKKKLKVAQEAEEDSSSTDDELPSQTIPASYRNIQDSTGEDSKEDKEIKARRKPFENEEKVLKILEKSKKDLMEFCKSDECERNMLYKKRSKKLDDMRTPRGPYSENLEGEMVSLLTKWKAGNTDFLLKVLLPESMITIAQKIKKMTRDEALDFLTTQAFYTRTEELQRNHLTI
eukprot:m.268118 g.268118  ORF g.268118 m.268118 type:complete len:524 (-) comp16255_c0_seq1:92-1663(-)